MKIVYVAGKFRGKTPWEVENNVRRAEEWGLRVAEAGAMPMIPHSNTRYFDGLLSAEFWLEGTKELLRRCDAIFLIPNWEESSGARAEKAEAELRGIPIFTEIGALRHWLDGFAGERQTA